MISVEALGQVEVDALVATVGLAPRVRSVASAPVEEQTEVEDELQQQEAKEKLTARLLELRGVAQLSSMRALMGRAGLKSITARLAWREHPQRSPADVSEDGEGAYALDRIKQYAEAG